MFVFIANLLGRARTSDLDKYKEELSNINFNSDQLFFYNKDSVKKSLYLQAANELNPNCHIRLGGGSSMPYEYLECIKHQHRLVCGRCVKETPKLESSKNEH
jgi:hypothetical protein